MGQTKHFQIPSKGGFTQSGSVPKNLSTVEMTAMVDALYLNKMIAVYA
jgi:hypothetical protein